MTYELLWLASSGYTPTTPTPTMPFNVESFLPACWEFGLVVLFGAYPLWRVLAAARRKFKQAQQRSYHSK
ncbi:MAG: hypothetical protein AAF333_07455 [Planctomycetota bacterium]